jgi:hypothetical protein
LTRAHQRHIVTCCVLRVESYTLPDFEAIGPAIQRGVEFLWARQMPNGEMPTYVSTSRMMGPQSSPDSTLTSTIAVLYSLRHLAHAEARKIVAKGREFLIGEMEAPGLWRYWTARTRLDIDLDLDDTCLASFVLRECAPLRPLITNVDLILAKRNKEGFFYTWFRPPAARNDIDSVVNANALLYLGARPETDTVCRYLNRLVLESRVAGSSHYYPSVLSFYYALSRSFHEGVRELIQAKEAVISELARLQQRDGSFGDSLATAQGCCCLLNLGHSESEQLLRGVRNVLENQSDNGSWPRVSYWAGPEPPQPYSLFWGAEEITTALSLECLSRFQMVCEQPYGAR